MKGKNQNKCKHKDKEINFYNHKCIYYYCPECNEEIRRYDKTKIKELIKNENKTL